MSAPVPQSREALARVFRRVILDVDIASTLITATLEQTPATVADVVAALVEVAQVASREGDTEEEAVGAAVAVLLTAWLTSAVRQ